MESSDYSIRIPAISCRVTCHNDVGHVIVLEGEGRGAGDAVRVLGGTSAARF
jgi:hypothetical protein